MTIKELIEHLEGYDNKEQTIAYDLWCIEDVEQQCRDREGIALTQEEKVAVLELMHRKRDCSQGLNWDVLDCCIDMILDERED